MISTGRISQCAPALLKRAGGRVQDAAWRVALAAVTASAAWVVAQHLLGQRAPVFAPIAAVVCLTDSPGVRGRRAVRLLGGVLVGVVVGEASGQLIGTGWLQIAVSLAVGMLLVSLASVSSLTLLQAGIAALLVVGTASPQTGWTRLSSALIGGALALLVSQVLAAPSPSRLLGDAATRALGPPRAALAELAAALRDASAPRARTATEDLRGGHTSLADFLDARSSAHSLARSTLRGRRERQLVASMQDRFAGIEYVYAGSLLLARTATELIDGDAEVPEALVEVIDELADVLGAIADDPSQADPGALPGPPVDTPASDRPDTRPAGARERANALVSVGPADHDSLVGQLATQLHLLAEDVAALTGPTSRARA